jgi:hypothetical protein
MVDTVVLRSWISADSISGVTVVVAVATCAQRRQWKNLMSSDAKAVEMGRRNGEPVGWSLH